MDTADREASPPGLTSAEAARRLDCGLRTVERRWQRVRQFWEREAPD